MRIMCPFPRSLYFIPAAYFGVIPSFPLPRMRCISRHFAHLSVPRPLLQTNHRTWNPLRRFCPFLPAWWAHIKNQRILNEYITGIIVRRWDLLQRENNISSMSRSSTPENFRVDNGVNGYSACGNVNGSGGDTKAAPTDNGELSSVGSMGAGAASGRVSTGRRRDILDKVLASLEPDEWGQAAILQAWYSVCAKCACVLVSARALYEHASVRVSACVVVHVLKCVLFCIV